MQATLKTLETESIFFVHDWKIDGDSITAIHGHDQSTAAEYAKFPQGFVMVTLLGKNGSRKSVLAPDTVAVA